MSVESCSRSWRAFLLLLTLAVAGCEVTPMTLQVLPEPPIPTPTPPAPSIPQGAVRFWFYRVFFPDDSGGMPAIAMNGTMIGYALAGTNFYRDMPAGEYLLTVETDAIDYNQSKTVVVAPGREVFVKIASLPSYESGELRAGYRRAAYYVMLPEPRWVTLELPLTRFTGGN